jgi:7-alpha-hydroxysteroid dehydrogenase
VSLLDQFRLEGRVAVVTGAGRGIGRAIACGLADAGCDVAITARRSADLDQVAGEIRKRGHRCLVAAADIRDFSEELAERTMAELGAVDVWVNNVGGSDEKTVRELVDTPDDIWRSQLDLNLTTAFQGAKAAARRMTDGGVIVNIASGAGMRGSPRTGPYAAAKAGMLNITLTLALELAPRGIRVNAVSPGPVVTEAFLEVLGVSDKLDELAHTVPLGRLGTPDDIAAAVDFLLSPAASFITGIDLLVDGGVVAAVRTGSLALTGANSSQ